MFAGKSTELTRRIRRFKAAMQRCLVVKYANDVRYSADCMTTHDQTKTPATAVRRLAEADALAADADVIGIDEGQFYEDLAECCERWANAGKTVIVAALDGTFQRKAFNRILELIPLAEEVTKLNAVCSFCQNDAAFTTRLGDETELEVIGGAEKYVATCRSCFNRVNAPACPIVRTGPRGGKKVAAPAPVSPGVAALSLSDGDMHTSP